VLWPVAAAVHVEGLVVPRDMALFAFGSFFSCINPIAADMSVIRQLNPSIL